MMEMRLQRRQSKNTKPVISRSLQGTQKRIREKHVLIYFLVRQKEKVPLRYLLALKYSLDPQFVDINVNINGKKSSFSIPDVMNVQIESCKNPVTGEEQETKIQLPKGFIWKLAEAAKSKIMHISTPHL